MRRSWFRKKIKKIDYEQKYLNAKNHFVVPELDKKTGYIFGFDLSAGRNFGLAVFYIENGIGTYQFSKHLKLTGEEKDSIIELFNMLNELFKEYKPGLLSCWEWALGGGEQLARSGLHECQGIVKLSSYLSNIELVKPFLAASMGTLLLEKDGEKLKREQKKTKTCEKIKELFPVSLEKRRVSQTGNFTHEADAIGFCVCVLKANNIIIKGEINETN